jgi:acyl-CoA synthetase (AMP-forming)/AMP-acid ligase II/acyl carrier protein
VLGVADWTVPSLVFASAAKHPKEIALQDPLRDQTLSYRELREAVEEFSRRISSHFEPGVRVGVILESGYSLSLWVLATMLRHSAVPLSPEMGFADLEKYSALTKIEGVITDSKNDVAKKLAVELGLGTVFVDSPESPEPPATVNLDYPRAHDIAVVLLTSGTTTGAKVVPLTHENLTVGARNVSQSLQLKPGEKCLVLWAQHHIGGVVDLLLAPLFSGGTVVNGGRYTSEIFRRLVHLVNPQWIQFVPTTLSESMRELGRPAVKTKLTGLRFVRCVAAPLPHSLRAEAERVFGCPVVYTYGLTEASPLVSSTRINESQLSLDSSGYPAGTEVSIFGEGDLPLETGATGEIAIRGRGVFHGYESPDSGRGDFTQDGWFKTGDLGHLSVDGELFVTGRKKFLVNRGGKKINPVDIENILVQHPHVSGAFVFGSPHERLGEMLVATVESDTLTDDDSIREFLRETSGSDAMPDVVMLVQALPRTETGKVQREKVMESIQPLTGRSATNAMSRLDKQIFLIWSQELDADDFDVDTSFVMAGGDSLSVARLGAELEAKFGVQLSEYSQLSFMTIRQIAQTIEQSPAVANRSPSEYESRLSSSTWLSGENVESLSKLIAQETRPNARTLLQEAALTLFSPNELVRLRNELDQREVRLGRGTPLWKWEPQPDPKNWEREMLSSFCMSYHIGADHQCADVLVGFTGNQGRLMLPIHVFLNALPIKYCRLVLLTDPGRNHYQDGIPGIGSGFTSLMAGLEKILPVKLRNSTGFIGTSAGAVTALICGLDNGSRNIGVVGPDALENKATLQIALAKSLVRSDFSGVRIAAGQTQRDLRGLSDLEKLMPLVSSRVSARAGHNVLLYAHRNNQLRISLSWLVAEA